MSHTQESGNAGETQACDFLTAKGYKILARNYRCKTGEIDIIAQQKKFLVFIEVKTRASSHAFGGPVAAVTPAKQRKIALAATLYIKETALKFDSIRFDIISVLPQQIDHIENAFTPLRGNL